jgi:hypothetical protein
VTPADATHRLKDNSRPPANKTKQLTRAILELAKDVKEIRGLLEEKPPRLTRPNSAEPSREKRGGRPPLDKDTMFMFTTKRLFETGPPQKADELIQRMREACRTAGIKVPAVSTLKPIAYKWMRILRGELK